MDAILSGITVSITDLRLMPAAYYERLLAYLEDLEDAKVVRERADGPFVEVSLDELGYQPAGTDRKIKWLQETYMTWESDSYCEQITHYSCPALIW